MKRGVVMVTSAQPTMPSEGTNSFFRKHNRLLTSVAAVVVVFTFVAREGIRDSFKTREDSIETAQNAYALRADTQSVSDTVRGVYIVVSDLTEELTSHPPGFDKDDPDALVVPRFNFYKDQLDGINRVLETAVDLLRALPQSGPELLDAASIHKRIEESRQRMDEKESDFQVRVLGSVDKHMRPSPEFVRQLAETTQAFTLDNAGLWNDVQRLASKALTRVTAEDDRYRRWYHWSTVASWVLYSLGVTLSLLTAIYSKSDHSNEVLASGE
jgi:hypothetical protein